MRIIQMLPTFAYGDAIGNDTLSLQDTLRNAGYETEIYADVIDAKLGKNAAKQAKIMNTGTAILFFTIYRPDLI